MERTLSILLLLMLPAISSAKAADVLVPAGPLSNALALVEANRIPDAMKTLATFRPDMATLGPYHSVENGKGTLQLFIGNLISMGDAR